MEAKSFIGKDMNEALRALRASLGPDALILQTRHVPAGRGTSVEITALPEHKPNGTVVASEHVAQAKPESLPLPPASEPREEIPKPSSQTMRFLAESSEQQALQQLRNLLHKEPAQEPELIGESPGRTGTTQKRRPRTTRDQDPEATGELRELRRELSELKSLLSWLAPQLARGTIVEELTKQGLSAETLSRVMADVSPHGGNERTRVRQALARIIPIGKQLAAKSNKLECLALIGPTGVGKTTTIVRLTAYFARYGERKMGWISLDNSRLTGSEQLVAYAGVLGIPCEVAENQEQFRRAYNKLSMCDLVLVDTAGFNPRDEANLNELARFMREIPELRRVLLLNATTNERDMNDWVTAYEPLDFDSLLFTKLDEGRYFGSLVNTALACGRPLSYLTTGQNVTNSLQIANADALAQLLLP
jgi:flagellar biosynthesis protein FlhF